MPSTSEAEPLILRDDCGLTLSLIPLGARLTGLWLPDRSGKPADVVLGHDTPAGHLSDPSYMGATCGRFANRIAGGRFRIDGVMHQLDRNEGPNHLHGGSTGFDSRIWDMAETSPRHVDFLLTSPAGDMGYPGRLSVRCTYRLLGEMRLMIEMTATTDAPTVVNLAHHSYFNLAGHGSGDVLDHSLKVAAGTYLPVDGASIPTGELASVAGTPFDFTNARPIGAALPGPRGYDHCFCLDGPTHRVAGEALRFGAELAHAGSGRSLRVWTSAPGLQVYTGAHFDGMRGKAGARYPRFGGVALETQGFPDAPNRPGFPTARLDPGQTYRHVTVYDFQPE